MTLQSISVPPDSLPLRVNFQVCVSFFLVQHQALKISGGIKFRGQVGKLGAIREGITAIDVRTDIRKSQAGGERGTEEGKGPVALDEGVKQGATSPESA